MLIVAGLGNPGSRYENTRHNAGFRFVEELAEPGASWSSKADCLYSKTRLSGEGLVVVKPQTYMNLSGEALGRFLKFFKYDPEDLLVVHDELDLETGRLQLRVGGSAAGNNGIKSIYQHLKTQEIKRLRVGIGHPRDHGGGAVDQWVLSAPRPEEQELLELGLQKAQEVVKLLVSEGFEAAKRACRKG